MSNLSEIRVGVVGTGIQGTRHAKAMAEIPGVRVTACMDAVPEKANALAQTLSIGWVVWKLEDLLDTSDAVCIATPDNAHADAAVAALNAGKHVLCEKPLATSMPDAQRVLRAARDASARGVVGMINFSKRNMPAVQAALKIASSGQLGQIRHFHGAYLQSWLADDLWGNWTSPHWLWKLSRRSGGGGVLLDIGVHLLDLATALTGDVARIRATLRTFPKLHGGACHTQWSGIDLDCDDSAAIEIESADSGAMGVLHTTRWATGRQENERLEIHGTEGALAFDLGISRDELDTCLGAARNTGQWTRIRAEPGPTLYQKFIESIRTGRCEQPDIQRGALVQSYLDACIRSSESGTWQPLPALQI